MTTPAHADTMGADTARLREMDARATVIESASRGSNSGQPPSEGLSDVVISASAICDVNGERGTLSYRGYDIGELACRATFEETAHLLWHGDLPSRQELDILTARLTAERELNGAADLILSTLPTHVEPMDALRTAVSSLTCNGTNGQGPGSMQEDQAICLVAKFPTIVARFYRRRHSLPPIAPRPDLSHAANFLYMVQGHEPTTLQAQTMDLAMLLEAEHGFNVYLRRCSGNSRNALRYVRRSDLSSGNAQGSPHGGANEQAMRMMLEIGEVATTPYIDDALARKQRIMGFGHRVYRHSADPRAAYLRAERRS